MQEVRSARGAGGRRGAVARGSAGQALVDVKACGVNFPDTLIIEGKYQFRPEPPFSPGGEVAGVVAEVGEGVTRVKPGDRVVALMPWGGYAERIVTDPAAPGAHPRRGRLRAGGGDADHLWDDLLRARRSRGDAGGRDAAGARRRRRRRARRRAARQAHGRARDRRGLVGRRSSRPASVTAPTWSSTTPRKI